MAPIVSRTKASPTRAWGCSATWDPLSLQPSDNGSQVAEQPHARVGLALVRLTIGAMFVWVFFENLGKGLYTPSGYAGLIQDYIDNGHAPAVWKSIMAFAAAHASMAAPLQGFTEI